MWTDRERERNKGEGGNVCGLTLSRGTQARLQKSFFNPYMIHTIARELYTHAHVHT